MESRQDIELFAIIIAVVVTTTSAVRRFTGPRINLDVQLNVTHASHAFIAEYAFPV
jgi:hypothetical protein